MIMERLRKRKLIIGNIFIIIGIIGFVIAISIMDNNRGEERLLYEHIISVSGMLFGLYFLIAGLVILMKGVWDNE